MMRSMLTVFTRFIPLSNQADVSSYPVCAIETYAKWIAAVRKNKTPVAAGDKYLWLEFSLLPPRLYNCVIEVKPGDDYPPKSM